MDVEKWIVSFEFKDGSHQGEIPYRYDDKETALGVAAEATTSGITFYIDKYVYKYELIRRTRVAEEGTTIVTKK